MFGRLFSSTPRIDAVAYSPPVTREHLREAVAKLDISRAAARLALNETPIEENQPSRIEAEINGLFDTARVEAAQITIARLGAVGEYADNLRLGGDEEDFSLPIKALDGDLAAIRVEAELELPSLAEEQAAAARAKGAFLAEHEILEPSLQPSLLYWFGIGVVVAFVEALVTASIYAPVFGDDDAFVVAGLIGVAMVLAGVVISFGILLTQHRRTRLRYFGPIAGIGGVAFFLWVASCAAHLRLFLADAVGAENAVEVVWSAVQTAVGIAGSLLNRARLPLTDPINLGFFAFSALSVSFFVYETHRTWGYWGFRRFAIRARNAVNRLSRASRNFVDRMKGAGKDAERELEQRVGKLRENDRQARKVTTDVMQILAAHSMCVAVIDAEHRRALAMLLDAYRGAVGKRKVPAGFARYTASAAATSDVGLPDLDSKMTTLRDEIHAVVAKRAQAQADVDTKVAEAVRALGEFVAQELAKASGVPHAIENVEIKGDTEDDPDRPVIEGEIV